MSLLEARGLSVAFGTRDGRIDAVRSVSFDVREGECVGFVGESGSGKSQTFHAIMGLLAKNGRAGGKVLYRGTDLLSLTDGQANRLRGDRISMIFQDPLSSLTPHLKIGTQMIEVLSVHRSGRMQAHASCAANGLSGCAFRKLHAGWSSIRTSCPAECGNG